jgi:chromosomal replication initiator protein DnaA
VNPLWARSLDLISGTVSEQDLSAWIRPLEAVEDGSHITLLAPNRVVLDQVRSRFVDLLRTSLARAAGYDIQLSLAVGDAEVRSARVAGVDDSEEFGGSADRLNPRYTLDSFIEGRANSQARAASMLVAGSLGRAYNPLLIYGPSGLGKTHLMHGIGNAALQRGESLRVVYVGAEQWFNQMVTAIRFGRQSEFKRYYRSADLLLIDDIHFLAGKEHSQEEFFHTFNALTENHKQIVLTCDRFPRELDRLDDRLKSRFTWGLSVPVEPPDLETRVAILLAKAEILGVDLPRDVAMLVGQRVRSNVRELEGALHRLNASSQLTGVAITVDFALGCLRDMLASYDRQVSVEAIKRAVCTHYQIRASDLASARRTRSLARPRQLAMALCKELTTHSYPEIGSAFGKDHTTVLHACRKIAELRETDERLLDDYEQIVRVLTR